MLPSVPAASGDQDGRPVVLIEGMAAGSAIVASRLPGLDEVIDDEVNGLLVPPGDADALAGALGRLLGDPALRERLASAASAAADDFSSSAVAVQYVELLWQSLGWGQEDQVTHPDGSWRDGTEQSPMVEASVDS